MAFKPLVYAVNSNSQSIASGGVINFGGAVRRSGCTCTVEGGNAVVSGTGYYDVTATLTLATDAIESITVSLYKDGVTIPGATASITTAASSTYAIVIPALVKQSCCCESTITAVVTGGAVTVSNASIKVVRL